jgi:hypothetical protein
VSTPPDHAGGERSPIASTVPSPIELQATATRPAVGSDQLLTEPICDAPQKRLASKAGYRARRSADDAFRERERQRVKAWRQNCPDKAKAQKAKARSANYHRPFVGIDSEGGNILARTSSTTACGTQGTTPICGARRQTTAVRPRG